MIAELARQALLHVQPVVGLHGLSPALAKSLQRAAKHLDVAATLGDTAEAHATIARVLTHLMRSSVAKAVHPDELKAEAAVQRALEVLALVPAEWRPRPTPPTTGAPPLGGFVAGGTKPLPLPLPGRQNIALPRPAPPSPPAGGSTAPSPEPRPVVVSVPDTKGSDEVRTEIKAAAKTLHKQVRRALLAAVSQAHRRRARAIVLGHVSGESLLELDDAVDLQTRALRWHVGSAPGDPLSTAEHVGDPEMLAAMTCVRNEADGISLLLDQLAACDTDRFSYERIAGVFHLSTQQEWIASARARLVNAKPGSSRAAIVRLLAETGALSPSELLTLLGSAWGAGEAEVVQVCAYALAWVGRSEQLPALWQLVVDAPASSPADDLLLPCAALGSTDALSLARQRVAAGGEPTSALIEMLAMAGDSSDASLLGRFAEGSHPAGRQAADAVAWLGRDPERETRLFRGEPWSVARVLERVVAGDEPIVSRRRLTLELAVRTGVRPPCLLAPGTAARHQHRLLREWTEQLAAVAGHLPEGEWIYAGRVTRLQRR